MNRQGKSEITNTAHIPIVYAGHTSNSFQTSTTNTQLPSVSAPLAGYCAMSGAGASGAPPSNLFSQHIPKNPVNSMINSSMPRGTALSDSYGGDPTTRPSAGLTAHPGGVHGGQLHPHFSSLGSNNNSSIPGRAVATTCGIVDTSVQILSSSAVDATGGVGDYSNIGVMSEAGPGFASAYETGRLLGNGSFGLVCEARVIETGELVAIKKVLQDPRYKNRELDVMKELSHPNVVALKDYFYTESPGNNNNTSNSNPSGRDVQRFLNVVMEHVPDTVYRVMKTYVRSNQSLPILFVRLYTYQMCRSLGYLHSLGICHRDIKPQNLLVDSKTHVLKLCDFGSAKRLLPSEHSVAYICSRFYRAPELMLGATEYTTAIDIWSIGCVLGELLIGKPLFAGETSVDQLVKIIQVLGTPTRRQMQAMNPNYTEFRFPDVRPKDWRRVITAAAVSGQDADIPQEALQLLDALLKYEPGERLKPYEALSHSFFDPLRDPACQMPEGTTLPPLFNFSEDELRTMSPHTRSIVVPDWVQVARKQQVLLTSQDVYLPQQLSLSSFSHHQGVQPNEQQSLLMQLPNASTVGAPQAPIPPYHGDLLLQTASSSALGNYSSIQPIHPTMFQPVHQQQTQKQPQQNQVWKP